ncbi:peptidoglycan-binding protein [Pseudanabaena biceps]|nr:peptidoglycan-binding protein [Pseudanabaena biceps]
MELVAYLHSETICERLHQGESVDQTLNCQLLDAIADSSRHAKSIVCVGLAAGAIAMNVAPIAAFAYTPEIALVQDLLARRGFNPGQIDGVKGDSTIEAIRAAQVFYGLEADGVVGTSTLAALQEDTYEIGTTPATPEAPAPETSSDAVKNVQQLLSDRGFYGGAIDGIKGAMTEEAIFLAQKTYGLIADGVAGSLTIAALEADTFGGYSAQTGDAVYSSVREGQVLLSDLGFYKGEIDGIQGSKTTAAIKAAQSYYGLTVDGVLGSETLSALQA